MDTMYSTFTDTILSIADTCIPRYKNVISDKHTGNSWWTKTCEEAVHSKKKRKL